MKGLRKYLTPFAPDQSGTVSVFFELGGMIVICDAGGCTGNICGFDEPRWFTRKSAVFSAGLRDMDAILGRDDKLADKLADAAKHLDVSFIVLIGTPVPAVIGTDYRGLKRMVEKRTQLPVIAIDTNGMDLYDKGEEKAWLELFKTFAPKTSENGNETPASDKPYVGILGLTPQSVSDLSAGSLMREEILKTQGVNALCYCMGDGLESMKQASKVTKNIVVSPSALPAAIYLEKTFNTPYEIDYPIAARYIPAKDYAHKKILIVQQQVMANAIRNHLQEASTVAGDNHQTPDNITVASWFKLNKTLMQSNDTQFKDEDDFINLVKAQQYDIIFADACMQKMIPDYSGEWIDIPQFSVSGRLITRK